MVQTGNPLVDGDFTIAAGATASDVKHGGGYGLASLFIPAGLAATGLTVKKEKDALAVPTSCDDVFYDADGTTEVGSLTFAMASSATVAQEIKLDPKYFHKIEGYIQLHLQAASSSSSVSIRPSWY